MLRLLICKSCCLPRVSPSHLFRVAIGVCSL